MGVPLNHLFLDGIVPYIWTIQLWLWGYPLWKPLDRFPTSTCPSAPWNRQASRCCKALLSESCFIMDIGFSGPQHNRCSTKSPSFWIPERSIVGARVLENVYFKHWPIQWISVQRWKQRPRNANTSGFCVLNSPMPPTNESFQYTSSVSFRTFNPRRKFRDISHGFPMKPTSNQVNPQRYTNICSKPIKVLLTKDLNHPKTCIQRLQQTTSSPSESVAIIEPQTTPNHVSTLLDYFPIRSTLERKHTIPPTLQQIIPLKDKLSIENMRSTADFPSIELPQIELIPPQTAANHTISGYCAPTTNIHSKQWIVDQASATILKHPICWGWLVITETVDFSNIPQYPTIFCSLNFQSNVKWQVVSWYFHRFPSISFPTFFIENHHESNGFQFKTKDFHPIPLKLPYFMVYHNFHLLLRPTPSVFKNKSIQNPQQPTSHQFIQFPIFFTSTNHPKSHPQIHKPQHHQLFAPNSHPKSSKKTTCFCGPKLRIVSGQPTAAPQVLPQHGPVGRRTASLQAPAQLAALRGVAETGLQEAGLASGGFWKKR